MTLPQKRIIWMILLALLALILALILFSRRAEAPAQVNGPSEIDFASEGVALKNTPGLEADKLYLLYEEPGRPALNLELLFDAESQCGDGSTKIACMALSVSDYGLYSGRRIKVIGTQSGKTLLVRDLTFLGP